MNQNTRELWRKPETVLSSQFDPSHFDSIRKGLQVIRGEIPDLSKEEGMGMELEEGEVREEKETHFSATEMEFLRDVLGPQLVHGNYSLKELREIVQNGESHSSLHKSSRR